jgi:signal transduction histidine kinase
MIACTIDTALSAAATQFAVVHQEIQEQYALTLVHDLRGPINYVKLSAYLIKQDTTASKESLHVAGKIDKHMDYLETMLKDLLDVSRVRAGLGLRFEFEAFRLDELAKELVEDMKEIHGERFELNVKEPVAGTWNRDGIRRVVENLIINALKYGGAATPVRLTVAQNATHAMLTVHNEGNPISIEERPRLFEKFQRATTAMNQTGWGLGLALVSGMVRAHRGIVRVESSPETGTDFIVELPKKP